MLMEINCALHHLWLFVKKNNFFTAAPDLSTLAGTLQSIGWEVTSLVLGGDTDEEEYFFDALGIKFAEGVEQIQHEARMTQKKSN